MRSPPVQTHPVQEPTSVSPRDPKPHSAPPSGSVGLHGPVFACVFASAICMIAWAQPQVDSTAASVQQKSDVYALPRADLLPAMSLGYRAALADYIWAHILVTQGLRMEEHRPFDHLGRYLDAVTVLEPKFREPYRLGDTLLSYQPNDPNPDQSMHTARRILEKGVRELPNDGELWINYGEFLAYVAPSFLRNPQDAQQWRVDGARALVHAGDLGGSRSQYSLWHAIAGVGILTKEGERDAMMAFLQRVFAITEDPELRDHIQMKLDRLAQGKFESNALTLSRAFDELWHRRLPFMSRTALRILGPDVPVWRCAGISDTEDLSACERSWPEWGRTVIGGTDR